MIFAASFSPILAYFTPTVGFMWALIIMFGFNIWAGMRSDGVSIKHCKRFSFPKFKNAVAELLLYVTIIHVIYSVMLKCGDSAAALIVIRVYVRVFAKRIPQSYTSIPPKGRIAHYLPCYPVRIYTGVAVLLAIYFGALRKGNRGRFY